MADRDKHYESPCILAEKLCLEKVLSKTFTFSAKGIYYRKICQTEIHMFLLGMVNNLINRLKNRQTLNQELRRKL